LIDCALVMMVTAPWGSALAGGFPFPKKAGARGHRSFRVEGLMEFGLAFPEVVNFFVDFFLEGT
jgi:hypothetical protein